MKIYSMNKVGLYFSLLPLFAKRNIRLFMLSIEFNSALS